ncbi:MAG: ArgE/DapE family deacylase [Chloroflexi bacterium]|nr:ArgE/DapE family deacylase [Chloroflexota bacterium]
MDQPEPLLLSYLADHPDRVVDLTRTLIGYNTAFLGPGGPTVEEKEAQEWIAGFLSEMGFEVDQWEPDVEVMRRHPMYPEGLDWKDRPITVATLKGTGGGKSLILNGHLDTVPADPVESWTRDPWAGIVEGDRLYGRGSCDMKGGIGAMLAVAEAIHRSGTRLAGDLIIEVVGDEETSGMGTLAAIERGYRADACLLPEPSGFNIWAAYRGILFGSIVVTGRAAHAEHEIEHWRAGGGVSAINKMWLIQNAIEELNREWLGRPDKQHRLLSNPQIVPTMIHGGEFYASVPARCELTLDITYLPGNGDERGFAGPVEREIEDHIQRAAAADPWLREHPPVIHWQSNWPAVETEEDSDIIQAMRRASEPDGVQPQIIGQDSWADAASYLLAGVPSISFGPTGAGQVHRIDESVSIAELQIVTRSIGRLLVDWCGAS